MIKSFLSSKNESQAFHISFITTVIYIVIASNFITYALITTDIPEYLMMMAPIFIIYIITVTRKNKNIQFIIWTGAIKIAIVSIIFLFFVLPGRTASCGTPAGDLIRSQMDKVYLSLFVYVWPYFQYDLISLYLSGHKKLYLSVLCIFLLLILILTAYVAYM